MTPDQTDALLEVLAGAGVLNRLTDTSPDVWASALGDLDARDCMQAAGHLIRTQQWVKIADIRQAVTGIRAERIRGSNPLYGGDPDETGAESARNLRALVDAAAGGRMPQQAITAALRTDNPAATPGVRARAAIEAVGRSVPQPREGVVNVMAVGCRVCQAKPGHSCTGTTAKTRHRRRSDVHPGRLEDARRQAAGLPPLDTEDTARHEASVRAATAAQAARALADADGTGSHA